MSSFPWQYARTRRFSLGLPRNFTISADGARVLFLRSRSGTDPLTSLYAYDAATGNESVLADPVPISLGPTDLPEAELRRRERARELSTGIVSYACDRSAGMAVFLLDGAVFTADVASGAVARVPTRDGPSDARPNPDGSLIAYVARGGLSVVTPGGDEILRVAEEGATWGLADFVAAEEMGRMEGYWWSPDGRRLAVARVDTSPVATTTLFDAANPHADPVELRYPFAGTANAEVRLFVVGVDGERTEAEWDRDAFPYLARVVWRDDGELTLLVQSRDQRRMAVLRGSEVCREIADERWTEIVPGAPAWTSDGRLVTVEWVDDDMAIVVDGERFTAPGVQVRAVLSVDDHITYTASTEPTEVQVWRDAAPLTDRPGVHAAVVRGDAMVMIEASADTWDVEASFVRVDMAAGTIRSDADAPAVQARPRFVSFGDRAIRTAVLFPSSEPPWPVLLDPYGGPHHQKAMKSARRLTESAWFADEGFAVLVADGRGTGGRGKAWDQAIHLDVADVVLEDQVDALLAAAKEHPELDLSRVAIRGASFGGYLAALAVLRRPDVFHAGIAIAPVSEWRYYDTHYTERYLGDPAEHPDAYDRSSLVAGGADLQRPLLLIHGLADDNVLPAHTLRLSAELVAAGRRHELLMLPGASHVMSQEQTTARLLEMQLDFLRSSLGVA